MRLTCLLPIGLIVLFTASQCDPPRSLLRHHPYDTLSQYSYLVATLDRRFQKTGFATAFFYRKDEKLYLVSAHHVFSACDVNKLTMPDDVPSYIEVWYVDTARNYKSQRLALHTYSRQDCIEGRIKIDADTMDVSPYFKDAHVYSVESFSGYPRNFNSPVPRNIFVGYGFSKFSDSTLDSLNRYYVIPARSYIGRSIDTPRDEKQRHKYGGRSGYYYYISPALDSGVSGAPIFMIRREGIGKKIIEFIGVQSASNEGDYSCIVKQTEIFREFFYLKE